jgi:hypothetical protein
MDLLMYFLKLEIGESQSKCQKNQESQPISGKILSNHGKHKNLEQTAFYIPIPFIKTSISINTKQ